MHYPQYAKFFQAKERQNPTMSSLAYIDDATTQAVERELATPTITDTARSDIKAKASKSIAGFRIHDEEAEKKMLDDMIADRKARLESFIKDRTKVREDLNALGVTALAVLPTEAWNDICKQAKLFRFAPNAQNRVAIDRNTFHTTYGSNAKKAESAARYNWTGYLLSLFPNYCYTGDTNYSQHAATLALPAPPARCSRNDPQGSVSQVEGRCGGRRHQSSGNTD